MSYNTTLYDFSLLNDEYYLQFKPNIKIDDHSFQMEHHIGRLLSIKKSMELCKSLTGDYIEFGCWQGQSLYNTLNIMNNLGIKDKNVVGIDCFEGIPIDYGHINCREKLFNDTSYEICLNNIKNNSNNFLDLLSSVHVLKAFFKESDNILSFLKERNIHKICFVHLDCDVVKSCEEALNLLLENDLLNKEFILQFDDWGIKTEIPEWFDAYKNNLKQKWKIDDLYETNLTKTFYFTLL
jgi:hypothetical protein